MRGLGYLPDPKKGPEDTPDWDASSLLSAVSYVPTSMSLRSDVREVLDQGSIGSCVANAGFQAIRMRQHSDTQRWHALGARLWGYYLARAYHNMEEWDTGTHIRTFFTALNKYGFLAEENYKHGYDVTKYAVAPPPVAIRHTFDQREPTLYYRIFETGGKRIDAIHKAIASGRPVVFGTDVSEDFVNDAIVPTSPIDPPSGSIAGGHAMVVVGYDEKGFDVVNSWGADWGDGGYCCFSRDYMAASITRDLWVVGKAPVYSEVT